MKQEDGHDLTKAGGNPEDELSAFEQFSLDFQSGLNGVLYILCKEVETNSLFVVMGMLMDFFQLVAFPFYNRIPFPWNTETIGWFQSIANYARIYVFFDTVPDVFRIFFYIAIAVVTLALTIAAMVGIEFSSGRFKYFFLLKILRSLAGLFVGFMYIPIVAIFTLNINCASADALDDTALVCGTVGHIVGAVFAAIVQLLYCSLSFILALNYYARLPTSAAVLSRPNARGVFMQLLFKTVTTMLFLYLRKLKSAAVYWILILEILFGSGIIAFHYSWMMPYYRYAYNMLHASLMWIMTWTCASLALVYLVNSPDEASISLLYFILAPLVAIACFLMMQMRRSRIEKAPCSALKTGVEVELKARFLLEQVTDEVRDVLVNNIDINMNEEKKALHNRLLAEADAYLLFGTRRFPSAAMYLLRAIYLMAYNPNKNQALAALSKAEQRQPSQDETFSIYLFRKQQEEGGSDGNSDVLGYMAFQQTLQDARRFDESTTKYQLMFWDELLKDKTDIGRLNDIATLINTAMVSAQENFRKLVKMNPNSTQVLRMYASFLIEIANESASGQKLIARADELEDQNTKTHGADNDESALFDDRNALVSISAEAKTLGAIVSANAGAVRMLGYSRADLVGRNIAMIMPAPFSNAHQSYLTRYLETGEARILNRSRIVFGAHRSGWIMPLDLFVREVSSPEGMTFLSVLRKPTSIALSQIVPAALREEKALENGGQGGAEVAALTLGDTNTNIHFAFVDLQHRVTACSVGCANLFAVNIEQIRAQMVEIGSWVPQFREKSEADKIRSGAGLLTFIQLPGARGEIFAHVMSAMVQVGADCFYLVQIAERKPPQLSAEDEAELAAAEGADVHEDEDESEGEEIPDEDDEEEEEEADFITGPAGVKRGEEDEAKEADDDESESEESEDKPKKAAFHARVKRQMSSIYSVPPELDTKRKVAPLRAMSMFAKSGVESEGPTMDIRRASSIAPSSAHTGISGVSSTTSGGGANVYKLHAKLWQFAKSRENKGLSEGLRRLRFSLVLVILFVVAISLARFFTTSSLIADYSLRCSTMFEGAKRRYLAVRFVLYAQVTLFGPLIDATGLLWTNFYTEEQLDPFRVLMRSDAADFDRITNLAYIQNRALLAADHLALYTQPSVTTRFVRDGSSLYDLSLTLWDASQLMTSEVNRASWYFILDIADTDPTWYYVFRNGVGELLTVLNTSTFMYQQDAASRLTTIQVLALLFLCAGIIAIVIVVFVVVRPKVLVVEQNKESVLLLFADIPPNLISAFQQKMTKRLASLRSSTSGDGAEDEDMEGMDGNGANGEQAKAEEEEEDSDEEGGEDAVEGEAAAGAAKASGAAGGKKKVASADGGEESDGDDSHSKSSKSSAASSHSVKSNSSDEDDSNDKVASMGITISAKAIRRAAQRAKSKIEQQDSFLQRNVTMLKISIVVAITIIYFAFSYWAEYANIAQLLTVAPSQVNWSQHRRLSLLLIMYDLRKVLTQSFFKSFEAGNKDIVDITEDKFFLDLKLLEDMEDGLAFGSTRFGTVAPTDATPDDKKQNELMFVNACPYTTDVAGCTAFSHGIFTFGMHAGVLEFMNQARVAYSNINKTINSDLKLLADAQATNMSLAINGAQLPSATGTPAVFEYLAKINTVFHDYPNTWIKNTSETFLADALGQSGTIYVQSVGNSIDAIFPMRVGTLVAFILLCAMLYFVFYSPMCVQLDAEQKRTSAMLLMIPADVMERIPSIRDFVARLDVKNV